jgi:Putative Flp pilus-assembly TadE/G-like
MMNHHASRKRHTDQGVSILIVAVSMVFVLGMAGLGIDLASLYVGKSQAQRAADAAALAGAQALVGNGCVSTTGTLSPSCIALAKQRALAIGNANLVAGESPNITDNDITFVSTSTTDPQIQVIAARDTSHSNAMPTFFVKIFGIQSANVSAKATAEAYNPAGGTAPVGAKCLKPWLLPNCDPNHSNDINTYCGVAKFIDNGNIVNPSNVSEGGVLGELFQIKSSDPTQASGPSQFYPVYLPPGTQASECPSCANGGGGGTNSGALYRQNIECCNETQIVCGTNQIQPITGNMVGPSGQGVDCLIHQANGGSGQDTFDPTTFQVTAGSANPYGLSGPVTSSDSVVTIPLYDGFTLCPGKSCPSEINVTVIGFLQMFLKDEKNGNIDGYVMNVVPCPNANTGGGTSTGGTGGVISSGASPIPIRLIHE